MSRPQKNEGNQESEEARELSVTGDPPSVGTLGKGNRKRPRRTSFEWSRIGTSSDPVSWVYIDRGNVLTFDVIPEAHSVTRQTTLDVRVTTVVDRHPSNHVLKWIVPETES